jgi:hypothetical protein
MIQLVADGLLLLAVSPSLDPRHDLLPNELA